MSVSCIQILSMFHCNKCLYVNLVWWYYTCISYKNVFIKKGVIFCWEMVDIGFSLFSIYISRFREFSIIADLWTINDSYVALMVFVYDIADFSHTKAPKLA